MKGFLKKDLFLTCRYCRSIFLIVAVFIVIGVLQEDNIFFVFYPAIMVSLISVSLLSYDEREHFCAYAATMPYPRATYVTAKYLIGLAFGLICVILISLVQYFSGNFQEDIVFFTSVLLFLVLLTPAVTLPFMFKFGVEKGRMVYYIMLGFSIAAALLGMKLLGDNQQITDSVLFLALCLVAVLLFLISWRLSVHFYCKREF